MSGHDPFQTAFEASVKGVQGLFPWLSRAEIITPPHEHFDAALARQMVIHLMVRGFNIPKRRVVEMQSRSREAVNRALSTVDKRIASSALFSAAVRRAFKAASDLTGEAFDHRDTRKSDEFDGFVRDNRMFATMVTFDRPDYLRDEASLRSALGFPGTPGQTGSTQAARHASTFRGHQ